MTVAIRPASPERDATTLHQLWERSMHADPLPRARFDWIVERAAPMLAWLGEIDGEPVGCVLTAADGTQAWLVGIGVEPDHRREGHGAALLDVALTELGARGCQRIRVGGPGEAYALPGIDLVAYPAAAALLHRAGFAAVGETFAMSTPLIAPAATTDSTATANSTMTTTTTTADTTATADRRPRADPPGVSIGPLADDRPAVLAMIDADLSPGWAAHLATVEDPERVLVARSDGAPIGFAAFDVFPGCPGRFGPTGVTPAARGRGVGGALLGRALAAMRRRGDRDAWFLWGPESDSGVAMYRTAGFAVSRHFTLFSRALGAARHDDDQDDPTGGT